MTAAAMPDPPSFSYGPITRTDLVRYAGASGDFNPLHHDDDFARQSGLTGVVAHGMFSAGLLASFLASWAGDRPVRRFKVRFLSPVRPGDTVHAKAAVVREVTIAGRPMSELQLGLYRQDGAEVVRGTAEIDCVASFHTQAKVGAR